LQKLRPSFETDARLAAMVNSVGDVYYVLDRRWRLVLFNEAAEAFFARPREEIRGRVLWDLYPGSEESPFAPLLKRAMSEGVPGRLTAASRVRPDRIVEFRVAPLGEEGIGVSLVDVTERLAVEEANRQSQERLDLAVSAHNIGIFDWHVPSGRIVWSPELEVIFGLEPGAFEGTAEAFQRHVLPEDLPRALADTEAAIAAGRDLVGFNFRIRRADGAVRWIEGVARVVYARDGSPERIVGTNIDVTERVLAEQAVRASRERLDLAVGAHAIGIFDWDVPTGEAAWTEELEEIFGLEPGGLGGHIDILRGMILPEDVTRLEGETIRALEEGADVVNYQYRIRRSDGAIRWVEGAARFIFAPGDQPVRVVGTVVDITDRKLAEQHQRLLINELNHRVKNTLAIVQSIAWRAFRSGGMTLATREAFEGRLSALAAAHDVLNKQNWEGASIGQIVEITVAPHDPGGGRLTIRGPRVNLKPKTAVALALAVHELVTNAVKHGSLSAVGGRVDVEWSVDAGRLEFRWCESGGPPVTRPVERGFGTRLLEQGLSEELQGPVRLDFRREGVCCEVTTQLEP
jgi:PAS domain S-box-containing protein